eukprot:33135_6
MPKVTFWPRLRISMRFLILEPSVFWQSTLMGKCAYTNFILYSKPLVTPIIMLEMWEHTERTAASSFLEPNHFSTTTTSLPSLFLVAISTFKCLKSRVRVPRGPLTVTTRALTVTVVPSMILTSFMEFTCLLPPDDMMPNLP